jgi:steroid delta-isomerase-like uncharacterized protein
MKTSRTLVGQYAVPGTLLLLGAVVASHTVSAATRHHAMGSTVRVNKALATRFYAEVFNTGNMAAADKYIARSYIEHDPFPGQPPTLAGLKRGFTQYRAAFPDLHFTVQDVIGEGDEVVVRWTATGTQKGKFMGIAPTGRRIHMNGVDIIRIVHGKAVEHWGYEDEMGMMQQLQAKHK